ncbi:hypothetical protein NPIL_20441 [Nephila pilipes]|uniref:Uncharacterized protein n=1 Tax=Nephila pilipes TaxID=299642 RepID=A0A8X6TQD0_NEPPI|nr:hypothetical protein NPIL_20441 [Nephila pilipes]
MEPERSLPALSHIFRPLSRNNGSLRCRVCPARLDLVLSPTIITKRPLEFPNDPLIHCYNPGARAFFHSSSSDCCNLQGMIHLRGTRMIARIKSVIRGPE